MGGFGAVGILRVLDGGHGADVLRHLAAEGGGEGLDATADAEDGQLTVIGQTGDQQLGEVALLVDAMEQRRGLLASPEGVDVAATAEDQAIDAVEGVEDDMLVGHRGYHKGYAACRHHGFVVALT